MPTHSAVFQQPGPELNPIGAKMNMFIGAEVFEVQRNAGSPPSGQWMAREPATQEIIKNVGKHGTVYAARYRLAQLFMKQVEPWKIDGQIEPQASGYHFHRELDDPSLCGSRYHQRERSGYGLHLPEVRACRRTLVPIEWQHLCEICQRLVDRTPAPGDKIRVRLTAETGMIISEADPNLAPGKARRYVTDIERGGHTPGSPSIFLASEITLCMFERDQPF